MGLQYSIANMELDKLKVVGQAACVGGRSPSPGLHGYPLLAWMHAGHPAHGTDVFTEDGKASVGAIARALAESPSFDALAARFGTSRDHVVQALDYAVEAGLLSA